MTGPESTSRPPEVSTLAPSEVTPLASPTSRGEKTLALPGTGPMPATLPTLRQLGHYRLLRLIGRGGMGAVWEAEDTRLGRHVAVKLALAGASPEVAERFRLEATHAARLRHPHIVPVHDVGCDQGQWYLVMDLVRGTTLADARREGLISYRRAAAILEAVARGVAHAHAHGVIHRDLKPENIMLELPGSGSGSLPLTASGTTPAPSSPSGGSGTLATDAQPLVMDFGLAKDLTVGSNLSHSGIALGTPSYMPPEQACGHAQAASPAADIYSLGAILYELLTGRPPFTGENGMQILHQVLREDPVPPRAIVRGVPRDLETICLACLQKEPARRYPSALALAEDLRAYLAGEPITARRTSLLAKAVRQFRRHRWRVAMVVLLLAVGLASAALYVEHLQEQSSWRVVLEEPLEDDTWQSRWRVFRGGFTRVGHELVTTGAAVNLLVCRNRFDGPVAIEYDGALEPGAQAGDLSCVWARAVDPTATEPPSAPFDGLTHPIACQFGTMDGTYTAMRLGKVDVATDPHHPVAGRTHHCRIEINDTHCRMLVDGTEVARYTDTFPLTGGYACLYGYYRGKAFSHLRISTLTMPQKLPATAVGDAFAQHGEWAHAQEAYTAVAETYAGSALAQDARYKAGLCAFRAGDLATAGRLWEPLTTPPYPERIALHRLEALVDRCLPEDASRALDRTAIAAVLQGLAARGRSPDAEIRRATAVLWTLGVHRAMERQDVPLVAQLEELHDHVFAQDHGLDATAAVGLTFLGRYQDEIDRYPQVRWVTASAMIGLGKIHECAETFTDVPAQCSHARYLCGDFQGVLALSSEWGRVTDLRVLMGQADQVLADTDASPALRCCALIAVGRVSEAQHLPNGGYYQQVARILGNWPEAQAYGVTGRFAQGAFAEVLADPATGAMTRSWAQQCQWLARLVADPTDTVAQRTLRTWPVASAETIASEPEYGIDGVTITPAVRALLGESAAWQEPTTRLTAENRWTNYQRLWYAVQLMTGRMDEATFRQQPFQLGAAAHAALWGAIAAERRQDVRTAVDGYTRFLGTRRWQRGMVYDPLRELFARWRLEVLGGDRALWSVPSAPDGDPPPGARDPHPPPAPVVSPAPAPTAPGRGVPPTPSRAP